MKKSSTLQTSRGEAVAPLAALTGRPIAWAERSATSASPLEDCSRPATIGNPEALSAGGTGAEPPSADAGPAGAPNLDTIGTTQSAEPSRSSLFSSVWMTLVEYRQGVKARALESCGLFARVQRCGTCGTLDTATAIVECACDLRSCPTCARRRANVARKRLDAKWSEGARPRNMGLYLLTFTLRYDPNSPDDLSVDGLKRRKRIVRDAVGFVWKRYLKPRGRAMAISLEVSPSGAVHIHALYHGRRPDAGILRQTYMFRAGDSPYVNCEYVSKPGKAIRELAKYMMKAASPKNPRIMRGGRGEFMHPVLAARAEVAFSGDRLFECLGAWRGADDDNDLPEQAPRTCPHCGANAWRCESAPLQTLLSELPDDWTPRFGRAGPWSKKNNRPIGGDHV